MLGNCLGLWEQIITMIVKDLPLDRECEGL